MAVDATTTTLSWAASASRSPPPPGTLGGMRDNWGAGRSPGRGADAYGTPGSRPGDGDCLTLAGSHVCIPPASSAACCGDVRLLPLGVAVGRETVFCTKPSSVWPRPSGLELADTERGPAGPSVTPRSRDLGAGPYDVFRGPVAAPHSPPQTPRPSPSTAGSSCGLAVGPPRVRGRWASRPGPLGTRTNPVTLRLSPALVRAKPEQRWVLIERSGASSRPRVPSPEMAEAFGEN